MSTDHTAAKRLAVGPLQSYDDWESEIRLVSGEHPRHQSPMVAFRAGWDACREQYDTRENDEIVRLRAALNRYGWHTMDCIAQAQTGSCSCGLIELLHSGVQWGKSIQRMIQHNHIDIGAMVATCGGCAQHYAVGGNDANHIYLKEDDRPPVNSVLQRWCMRLPLREQGTLLTAVRGCDVAPKRPYDSLERRLVAAIRWSFMNPADPREVDIPGAFFSSDIPKPEQLSGIGHYPQHWFSHVWHAVEVLGYRHPDASVGNRWHARYRELTT